MPGTPYPHVTQKEIQAQKILSMFTELGTGRVWALTSQTDSHPSSLCYSRVPPTEAALPTSSDCALALARHCPQVLCVLIDLTHSTILWGNNCYYYSHHFIRRNRELKILASAHTKHLTTQQPECTAWWLGVFSPHRGGSWPPKDPVLGVLERGPCTAVDGYTWPQTVFLLDASVYFDFGIPGIENGC